MKVLYLSISSAYAYKNEIIFIKKAICKFILIPTQPSITFSGFDTNILKFRRTVKPGPCV